MWLLSHGTYANNMQFPEWNLTNTAHTNYTTSSIKVYKSNQVVINTFLSIIFYIMFIYFACFDNKLYQT